MLRLALASVAVLALSGCNLCDRLDAFDASFQEKHKACLGEPSNTNGFNKANCNEDLSKCTAADQEIINKYLDCMDRIPACQSGGGFGLAGAELECLSNSNLTRISSGCGAVL